MRSLSGAERTLIGGSRFDVHLRAFIRDAGGTFRDLTNHFTGRNWLLGVTIRESLDSPSATATVTLSRTEGGLTIAPGVSGSAANSGGAFLDVGRELYVETACVAAGVSAVAGDWRRVFWGRVDRLDTGDRERIVLECRDLSGAIMDRFLEAPLSVGSASPGTAVETVMQAVLDAPTSPSLGVTLATPVSPAFGVFPAQTLDAVSVGATLRRFAGQIGWDVRYRWTGATTNELRLFQPDRAKTTPDLTIGPGEYLSVKSWAAALEDVRNVVTVQYRSATGALQPTVLRSNSASITAYGRRAMRLGGDTTDLIKTQAQAEALADAVLADLALPTATHQIETLYLWPVEVGDLWRFSANAVHYDGNQDYAVVAIEHELTQTTHRTRVTARGKPAARYYGWLREGITAAGVIAAAITNAAPGGNVTQAEITYSSSGGTLTVLKNGTAVTPGTSPWVVNRPPAGVADVYEFVQTAGTVRESVIVTVYSNEMFSGGSYAGGSGTAGRLARWATPSTLGDSVLEDDGTHAFPTADATRDFGTAARRWRDIRASRDVYVGGVLNTGTTTVNVGAGGADGVLIASSAGFSGYRITAGSQAWAFRAAADSASIVNVTAGVNRTTWHASGGISLLDATDPGAGVVRVAGALTTTGRITGSNGLRLTAGGFQRPDDGGLALQLGNGTNDHYGATHNFRDAPGSGWGDVVTGALRPGVTATHDLGLTGTRFRDLFLSRDAYLGERLVWGRLGAPSDAAAVIQRADIGDGGSGAGALYWQVQLTPSTTAGNRVVEIFTGDNLAFRPLRLWVSRLEPGADASYDFGTASRRWAAGWFSGLVTVDRIAAVSTTIASTFPGGLTGRSGTRVPEIYIQSTDPGAVGAGAIWIQT
ncbi:MAG: hypothetical protein ACK6DK_11490 [Gemmatimonadota bacterium]|jgi:hypothetical protein